MMAPMLPAPRFCSSSSIGARRESARGAEFESAGVSRMPGLKAYESPAECPKKPTKADKSRQKPTFCEM